MTKIARVGTESADLGEGPMWSVSEGALYWFDVVARRLFRYDSGQKSMESWALERIPAAFGWRREGGLIFAFRNGLAITDEHGQVQQEIDCGPVDFSVERFNDGAVDRAGRFWVGSFHPRVDAGGGNLYRVDRDLSIHRMDTGATMSNGIAWSPDNRFMYFSDSRPGCIWRYDFDFSSGNISNRKNFMDYAGQKGRPDGMTVDAEGCLWIAEVEAGRVARYTPDGHFISAVELPVTKGTSVTFGGLDCRSLFVTSMRIGIDETMLQFEPDAGGLFHAKPGPTGIPEPMFEG